MICETITQEYINEYGNVFKNSKQTPESIKMVFSVLAQRHTTIEIETLDSQLFKRSNNSDTIKISGDRPVSSNPFRLPSYINSIQTGLSDIDILEIGLRFIELYDSKKQDFKNKVLPLLIIFICLKTNRFVGESNISYKAGLFSISFSSNISFTKNDMFDSLKDNILFEFFNEAKIITTEELLLSFSKTIHADTTDGYWHSYIMLLDADEQKTCIAKTRFWLSYCGELTRKEIEEITNNQYSERSINNALHKMVSNGEVEIIGSTNSPTVKYRYICKDEKFI
ncbi:MAG: hypothetical protein GX816_02545 [Erysipelotrichia bacterium]|jgi:hypothetical protein|nr:hypothetical protein [Erysipelotrichia bacterium]